MEEVKAAVSTPKHKAMRIPLAAMPDCTVPGGCPAPLCNDPKNRIYFIRSGDFIKIGFSKNTDYRMRHLQIANPHPLELVIEIEGDKMIENYLHLILKREHHRGEWFHFNETVARFIEALKGGANIDEARALCALFPAAAPTTGDN